MYVCTFLRTGKLFSSDRGSFLAFSAAGHTGGSRTHCDASLGPGRTPWRVLWAFKVARAGSVSRDCIPRRRAAQDHGNPKISARFALRPLYHTAPPALEFSTLRRPRYNHSRASSVSLCGGHRRCFWVPVCAMILAVLGNRNGHIISRAVQLLLGQDD